MSTYINYPGIPDVAVRGSHAAIDIETTVADNYEDRELISVAVAIKDDAWVYGPDEWAMVFPLWKDAGLRWIGHNGLFDFPALRHFGYAGLYYAHDTMGMAYLLDPDAPKGLEALGVRFKLGGEYKDVDYKRIKDEPFEKVAEMNAVDAVITYKLMDILLDKLDREGHNLLSIYNTILMPANRVFADMSVHGIPVDKYNLDALTKQNSLMLDMAQDQLNEAVGRELNVNSPKQVNELLYEELELPVLERTATGKPSSGRAVLQRLAIFSPIAKQIDAVRALRKQKSAFLDAWPKLMDKRGYLHPTISPMRVVTGRTNASGPNIQQVPRTKEYRNVFGGKGSWIKADYSQIELRVAAHVAQEERMIHAYRNGIDLHRQTAELVLGDASDEARQIGKVLNFGLLYGAGANKLLVIARDQYGVDLGPADAERYHREFFEAYPGLLQWQERTRAHVRKHGWIRSPLGRVRFLPAALGFDDGAIWAAQREALNMPIQSFASDILLNALINTADLGAVRCRPVAAVHDEVDYICHTDDVEWAAKLIKEKMEDMEWLKKFGVEMSVPLVADVETGTHWGNVV
jgi:DNA polymerase-1